MSSDVAPIISACATAVYAVISAASLWLLSRQIRDARRFGAAPARYALLKESEEHITAVRRLGEAAGEDPAVHETISRALEFFERIEHLRSAGVLPLHVLSRSSGEPAPEHLLAHTSPVGWEHIAISGDFLWDRAAGVSAERRPLRLGRQARRAA